MPTIPLSDPMRNTQHLYGTRQPIQAVDGPDTYSEVREERLHSHKSRVQWSCDDPGPGMAEPPAAQSRHQTVPPLQDHPWNCGSGLPIHQTLQKTTLSFIPPAFRTKRIFTTVLPATNYIQNSLPPDVAIVTTLEDHSWRHWAIDDDDKNLPSFLSRSRC